MKIPKAVQNLIEAFERLPGIGSKTAARLTFYLLHVPEAERGQLGQAVLELSRGTAICESCFSIANPTSAEENLRRKTLRVEGSKPEGLGNAEVGESTDSTHGVLCDVCSDPDRDRSVICVVEDPLDLLALERTGKYKGLYHVLHGAIAPLEHIGPEDLKIDELMARLKPSLTSEESITATSEVVAKSTSSPVRSTQGDPERRSNGSDGENQIKEVILATNPSLEGEATAMYIKKLISNKRSELGEIKVTRIARGIPTGGDLEYADEVTLSRALEGRQEY